MDIDNNCPICWEDTHSNENYAVIRCGHRYHFLCLYDWITKDNHTNCPLCTISFKEENPNSNNLNKEQESEEEDVDEHGNSQLLLACINKLPDVALAIIQEYPENVDFGRVNNDTLTPLMYATKNNMEEVALALIATGESNIEHKNKHDFTVLTYACNNNLVNIALALLDTDNDAFGCLSDHGDSELQWACHHGMIEVSTKLIEYYIRHHKAHLIGNQNTGNAWTALMTCCFKKYEQLALQIITSDHGNCSAINKMGKTALIIAIENKLDLVACKIIKHSTCRPIDNLFTFDPPYKVKSIDLSHYYDENSNFGLVSNDMTPLMLACMYKMSKTAYYLVRTGQSNHNYKNSQNQTAYTLAVSNGLTDVSTILKKHHY